MKILNPFNKVIGRVEQDKNNGKYVPFHYRYIGNNNISFPVHADALNTACYKVCKYFGEGYFYHLFTI